MTSEQWSANRAEKLFVGDREGGTLRSHPRSRQPVSLAWLMDIHLIVRREAA